MTTEHKPGFKGLLELVEWGEKNAEEIRTTLITAMNGAEFWTEKKYFEYLVAAEEKVHDLVVDFGMLRNMIKTGEKG